MAASTVTEQKTDRDEQLVPPLYLVVTGPNLTVTHRLLPGASMLVGRAEDAPVRLLDAQASRRHAVIHVGAEVEIEDLGSANGTRLRDAAIEPGRRHRLLAGDAVIIGDTVLTLQRRERTPRAGAVSPHASFEGRLIEECARAESVRRSFAVLRIRVEASSVAEEVVGVIRRSLRPGDVLAAYGPSHYEALLPDSGQTQSETVAVQVKKALAEAGIEAGTGLACYPADGTSPQALISTAGSRMFDTRASEVVDASGMVLRDRQMRELYQLAERAAATSINLIILGETGVGKEILAQTIHRRSLRSHRPLLSLNCAALSEPLLESELFGHERGAFTGAVRTKPGLLESADGGTVFLDEVGEMSGTLQAKLLRAIESKKVLRVGGTRPILIDVRFLAATNRDLDDEVAHNTFRADLYFRLNGMSLIIPPLRERLDEIEPLARHFLERAAVQFGRQAPEIAPDALAVLREHSWPGNIRELRNVMERALLLCEGDRLEIDHLPPEKMRPRPTLPALDPRAMGGQEAGSSWRDRLEAGERKAILDALSRCAGNQTRAAELLGMPRRTFCLRLKEYNISRPRA